MYDGLAWFRPFFLSVTTTQAEGHVALNNASAPSGCMMWPKHTCITRPSVDELTRDGLSLSTTLSPLTDTQRLLCKEIVRGACHCIQCRRLGELDLLAHARHRSMENDAPPFGSLTGGVGSVTETETCFRRSCCAKRGLGLSRHYLARHPLLTPAEGEAAGLCSAASLPPCAWRQ